MMLVVNFKLYEEYLDTKTVELACKCFEVAKKTGVNILPVISPFWVYEVFKKSESRPLVGHCDMYKSGRKTGYLSPLTAKMAGAAGSLLNHSEHQVALGTIASTLANFEEDFFGIVCCKSLEQAKRILKRCKPKFLAYEPPYLIASKDKSVASERIEVFARICRLGKEAGVEVLAGAGVRKAGDIEAVIKSGGKGVILSSEVMKSENPERTLLDLCKGFGV